MRKFPCDTTRQFDKSIHPKNSFLDFGTVRLQIQRHPKVTWSQIETMLRNTSWNEIFTDSTRCSKRGVNLVATYRMRIGEGNLQIAPKNWKAYKVDNKTNSATKVSDKSYEGKCGI